MPQFKRILVAIREPSRRSQRALDKAAQLAGPGGRLELFHALTTPIFADALLGGPEALIGQEKLIHDSCLERLERLAAPLRERGLKVDTRAEWDYPAAHAIVRRSQAIKADLIVVDSHSSTRGWLLRHTDWELLRLSPKPVLIVKSADPYQDPAILVALDPTHRADKPARLDAEILAAAGALRHQLGGRLHALHAYVPAMVGLRPEQMARPGFADRLEARARAQATRALRRSLKTARAGDAEIHVVGLHPVNAIPNTARKVGAAITVMGAISRSGLKRLFIGNTAEAVLDELRGDVLVVKPPRFARQVAKETAGPNLRSLGYA